MPARLSICLVSGRSRDAQHSGSQIVQQDNALNSTMQAMFGQTPATLTYEGLAPGFVGVYLFKVISRMSPPAMPLTFGRDRRRG